VSQSDGRLRCRSSKMREEVQEFLLLLGRRLRTCVLEGGGVGGGLALPFTQPGKERRRRRLKAANGSGSRPLPLFSLAWDRKSSRDEERKRERERERERERGENSKGKVDQKRERRASVAGAGRDVSLSLSLSLSLFSRLYLVPLWVPFILFDFQTGQEVRKKALKPRKRKGPDSASVASSVVCLRRPELEGRKEEKKESGKVERGESVSLGGREKRKEECASLSLSLSLSLLLQQSSKMLYPLPPVMAQLSVTPIQTLSFYLSLSLCRRGRKWMEEMSRMNVCSVFFSERLLHAAT
jgi:hypothetical protein